MKNVYLSEIQKYHPLSKEQEQYFAMRFQKSGDRKAAQALILSNLKLVVKIAFEFQSLLPNYIMDLVQEGNIGLTLAVKKFDISKGTKFSSYAAFWIRAYMFKFTMQNYSLIKIGTTQSQRKLFFRLRKETQKLIDLGIEPSPEQLSKQMQIPKEDIIQMDQRLKYRDFSLNATMRDSNKEKIDTITSPNETPEELVAQKEILSRFHYKISKFKKTLSDRELEIFESRTIAEEPLPLQQLGDRFGICRERIRQIENKIINKLKTFICQEYCEGF